MQLFRKGAAWLFTLAMLVALMPGLAVTASAADAVSYIEYSWDSDASMLNFTEKSTEAYTVVTDSTTAWNTGTYVATGSVTINSRVTVSGSVNLILTDGCDLTVNGGINVNQGNPDHLRTARGHRQTDRESK